MIFAGVSGLAGTMELEPVDRDSVALSLVMILAGTLCGIWAAWENGGFRRRTGR